MNDFNKIDDFFKKGLKDYKIEPSEKVWNNIQQKPISRDSDKFNIFSTRNLLGVFVAATIISVVLFFIYQQTDKQPDSSVLSVNNIKPVEANETIPTNNKNISRNNSTVSVTKPVNEPEKSVKSANSLSDSKKIKHDSSEPKSNIITETVENKTKAPVYIKDEPKQKEVQPSGENNNVVINNAIVDSPQNSTDKKTTEYAEIKPVEDIKNKKDNETTIETQIPVEPLAVIENYNEGLNNKQTEIKENNINNAEINKLENTSSVEPVETVINKEKTAENNPQEIEIKTNELSTDKKEGIPVVITQQNTEDKEVTTQPTLSEESDPRYVNKSLLSIGVHFTPEIIFNPSEKQENKHSYIVDADINYQLSDFIIQTGIGIVFSEDKGTLAVRYQKYLGAYDHLDSISFSSSNGSIKPTYYTTRTDVYDTTCHTLNEQTTNHYTYLQLPLILGYKKGFKRISFTFKGGPLFSMLIHSNEPDANTSDNGKKIVNIDDNMPTRIKSNWQVLLSVGCAYQLTGRLSIAIEPTYRYYMNSIYVEPSKKPYSIGLRTGIMLNL